MCQHCVKSFTAMHSFNLPNNSEAQLYYWCGQWGIEIFKYLAQGYWERKEGRCEEKRLKAWALGAPGLGGQGDEEEPARSLEATAGELRGNQGSWRPRSQARQVSQEGSVDHLCQMMLIGQVSWEVCIDYWMEKSDICTFTNLVLKFTSSHFECRQQTSGVSSAAETLWTTKL